jgi:hypothetical protein
MPGSIANKKQGGVSRHDEIVMGLVFCSDAATAAMPSGILIFLFTFFIKEKSKEEVFAFFADILVTKNRKPNLLT